MVMAMDNKDCATTTVPESPGLPTVPSLPASQSFDSHRVTVGSTDPGVPFLRLRGRWLERAGFEVNAPVRVEVSDRRLVLEVCEPEGPSHCAEPNCPHEAKAKPRRHAPKL